MRNRNLPPPFLEMLLGRLTPPMEREPLLGDFEESFILMTAEKGRSHALGWYFGCICRLFLSYIRISVRWRIEMFINELKSGFRHIIRHKGYSAINIAGLALGMACALFILLWVQNEMSFDRFHSKAKNIFRVEQDQITSEGSFHVWDVPYVMGPELQVEIPEVKNMARQYRYLRGLLVRYGEKSFYESRVEVVDPSFFQIFSFPLVRGESIGALSRPNAMIISEEMAEKYFDQEDPVGKNVILNNTYSFTITGVLKEIPENSTIRPQILLPFEFLKTLGRYHENWGWNSITTWVELEDNISLQAVNGKITDLVRSRRDQTAETSRQVFMLMPLVEVRMHGVFGFSQNLGSMQSIKIFSVVALLVLFIACMNFMNLSTARSVKRSKEVGMRKVVGASRRLVARRFYAESTVTTSIAALLSFLLVVLLLPAFNSLAGTGIAAFRLFQKEYVFGMLAVTVFTSLLSGSYPAVLLSSFQPIQVLRGRLNSGIKGTSLRKTLVVVQFTLSILLLIGTAVVYRQLNYMRTKQLGYEQDHLVYMQMRGESIQNYQVLKEELLKQSRILNVSGSSLRPSRLVGDTSGGAEWDGKDPELQVILGQTSVDFDYTKTMKIEMAAGRSFSRSYPSDRGGTYLVNQEVVKLMGIDDDEAVGRRFDFVFDGTIVGVMKNFHLQSVKEPIEPRVFIINHEELNFIIVRVQAGDIPAAIEEIGGAWNRINPNYPFEYRFFDEDFEQMYRSDERMGAILRVFTLMSVLIACLGLFGLVSFAAEQRTKEIGIRKVLGASVPNIVALMSKEFALWVVTANLIAWPLGYYVMRNWLQGFAFRTAIAWWLFLATGLVTMAVALVTVGFQAVRAAQASPIKALKYE